MPKEQAPDTDRRDVAVFIEQRRGVIPEVSYEMLGAGRQLADELGEQVTALMVGAGMHSEAAALIDLGADAVHYVDGPGLAVFRDDTYTRILADLLDDLRPSVLLAGATTLGRSLMARAAAKIHTGLTADCTHLEIDAKTRLLLGTRPAFGGSLMATIVCRHRRPQMVTVRPGLAQRAIVTLPRSGQVVVHSFEAGSVRERTTVVEIVDGLTETVDLTQVDVIVSGGRGLGRPDNFRLLDDLAEVLGGAVGASRAVVDAGWIDGSRQIGQTGKTVRPRLYIACGISGAMQHVVGMQASEFVIAINTDPDADIFRVSDLGIVGDALQVVPALTEALRTRREGSAGTAREGQSLRSRSYVDSLVSRSVPHTST